MSEGNLLQRASRRFFGMVPAADGQKIERERQFLAGEIDRDSLKEDV